MEAVRFFEPRVFGDTAAARTLTKLFAFSFSHPQSQVYPTSST